jgi:hypothetical protein
MMVTIGEETFSSKLSQKSLKMDKKRVRRDQNCKVETLKLSILKVETLKL